MRAPSRSIRRAPTQARARHTVDAILEAAAEVFDAHGFEGGTMERIVARAGVSVGSMYQYFPNKSALLVALAARYCADVTTLQRAWLDWLATANPSLEDGLRAFVDWLVASHSVRPRLRCLLFEARPVPPEVASGMAATHTATVDGLAAWLTGRVARPRVTAVMLHRTVPMLVHQFVLHPRPDLPANVATAEVFTLARAYLGAVAIGYTHAP
jgi:AcrR family transcriptional regulator